MSILEKYEVVIGLEIHAQISTKTKMFCRCDNDSFGKDPNINVCPVCMGHPGQLPVLNELAVEKGIRGALALGCEIPEFSKFDRKQYFYPDSPKGFQISQYDQPVSVNGNVEIFVNGKRKNVGITRLHLEDDAGKLTHVGPTSRNPEAGTLCDYNRAGTPLMEIVTEPDLRSAEEAVVFAKEVQAIMRYVDSSDAEMEKGMMRFDASISLRPHGEDKLYPRSEVKNLNSFKALEAAINYEISRQGKLWEEGTPSSQDTTVGWSEEKQKTYFMRDKEGAADYRYFPEPDLPPLFVSKDLVKKYKAEIPELPSQKRNRYVADFGLKEDDARILALDLNMARYFEKVVKVSGDPKKSVSFINTILLKHLKEDRLEIGGCKVEAQQLGELIKLVVDGEISNNQAKGLVFEEMYETGKSPQQIVEENGLKQMSDEGELKEVCQKIIDLSPSVIEDIRGGKLKAMGALVGLVMKETKGQANPQKVNDIFNELLGL